MVWCELNDEQDALAEALGPECVSIFGSLESEEKERRLEAFIRGDYRILLTKPRIAGWGINLQSVARMAFVGVTHSFEAYYQAVRRCWRFGQTRPVHVHVFASELEGDVVRNLQRKEADAAEMAEAMRAETRAIVQAEVRGLTRTRVNYEPRTPMKVPAWLKTEAA